MTRGTTPTLTFTLSIAPSRFEVLYITAKQTGRVAFEKTLDEMTKNESAKTVSFRLSQEDTLAMSERAPILLQARGRLADGSAVASEIRQLSVGEILKEGVI